MSHPKRSSLGKRLEKINCPFIDANVRGKELVELLLHPNDKRIKLITWLIMNFDSSYGDILDDSMSVVTKHYETLHRQLLVILNTMGLAKIDDLELLKGMGSQKKQLMFWDEFVDICYTAQIGEPYTEESKSVRSTSFTLPSLMNDHNLQSLHKETCTFLDSLVRKHKTTDIFKAELQLLPPDLENIIKLDGSALQVPKLCELEHVCDQLCTDVELLTKKLEEEKTFPLPDPITVDKYCRLIDLSLKSFSQRMDNYVYYHSNDIEMWCDKRIKLPLTELGHSSHVVSNMYTHTQKLVHTIKRYKKLAVYIRDNLGRDLHDGSLKSLSDIELNLDRSACAVLQNSLCRRRLAS